MTDNRKTRDINQDLMECLHMVLEAIAEREDASASKADGYTVLMQQLRQLHKYLWGEHFASHEKYNAAFERDDKEGMAKALCRTRAYADAADRLNDILQQNP